MRKCWDQKPIVEEKKSGQNRKKMLFFFSSPPPLSPVTLTASPLVLSRPIVQFALADLLSARCPTQARDTVYWKRFCLYLVPLSFRSLKAWPPCCLTHHSLPPPTSLSTPAVRFPGDPHSLAAWPGWSSVRVGQGVSRQGYRLQPSCMRTGHRLPQCYPSTLLSATVWSTWSVYMEKGCTPSSAWNNKHDCKVVHPDTLSTY